MLLRNERLNNKLITLLLVLFSGLSLVTVVFNHYSFRTYAFDYSAYNFAFFDYAHLRISPCPIYLFPYPVSFLQDHFSLTLMLLAPLYWLLGGIMGTYTLIFIQWIIVVFGAWATYRLIFMKTSNTNISLLASLYYFILLGRFTSATGDCNIAIIGSALIPVFLYYFELGKVLPTVLCFLFLMFNREDYALWLLFVCLFLIIIHRKEKSKLNFAFILFLLSLLLFTLIFQYVIPTLEDENKKYTLFNFSTLGKTPLSALGHIVHNPIEAFKLLFVNHSGDSYYDGIKYEFYWVYFLSGGFLLFFKPAYLIPFIPLIAKKMYNDDPARWGIESFYSIEVVSLLPVMLFVIISQFKSQYLQRVLALFICCLAFGITASKLINFTKQSRLLGDPEKFNFLNSSFYQPKYDITEIYKAMRLLPDTASVSSSGRLSTHLAFRKKIYYFPRIDDAQYIFLLKRNDTWPLSEIEFDEKLQEITSDKNWEIILNKKDIILLKKHI